MTYLIFKTLISASIIVVISELAKRSTWLAAFVTSLPIVSIIAMVWIYVEGKDIEKVADLSWSILWLVIPSLLFFIVLPACLHKGLNFYMSMFLASVVTALGYIVFIWILAKFGVVTI